MYQAVYFFPSVETEERKGEIKRFSFIYQSIYQFIIYLFSQNNWNYNFFHFGFLLSQYWNASGRNIVIGAYDVTKTDLCLGKNPAPQ